MSKIRSIAVEYGSECRGNDWYRENVPDLVVADRGGLAKALSAPGATDPIALAMQKFRSDPFRGARVRYRIGEGDTSLSLELAATRRALAAAKLDISEIDVILSSSWLSEKFVPPGNGVFLAKELGATAAAINVESACSGGFACLELADSLLQSGRYKRVLVILSNTMSRHVSDENTLSWIASDAAAAAVMESDGGPSCVLGSAMENTAQTCNVFAHRVEAGEDRVKVEMEVGPDGTGPIREVTKPAVVEKLCRRALERANTSVDDIALFAPSSPVAWAAEISQRALGTRAEQMQDLFLTRGNVGMTFPLVHLYEGMLAKRIKADDKVLIYTLGAFSSMGAMVMRANDWAIG